MVSGINRQVSFLTVITWSFVSLLLVIVTEVLAKLDAKEGGMEIEEYVFLEEELIPKTYVTN